MHGPNTLNREHAHVEYTLLAGTVSECRNQNHNILTTKPNTTSGYEPDPLVGVTFPSIMRA